MQGMSDIELMSMLFAFLATFYVSVILIYLKTRTSKKAFNITKNIPVEYTFSQSEHIIHERPHHNVTFKRGDDEAVMQVSNSTKDFLRFEPPLQPRPAEDEVIVNPEKGVNEVEKIVELIESSVKDAQMSKGTEEVHIIDSDRAEILNDYNKLDYRDVSENFVKRLEDLKDAIGELRKRIVDHVNS